MPKSFKNLHTGQDRKDERILVLEAGRAEKNYWQDLWHFRELFAILAWRDIAVRYKQTIIGASWAVVRPLLAMLIFSFIFGSLAKLPSGGVPYPVLVSAGLLPWTLFSTILTESASSLIANSGLVSKVYFPRMIMPAAAGIVSLVDFAISLVILAGVMAWYQFIPDWNILLLPLVAMFAVLASLGPALFISALNVKYRDFRFIVPFIVQFGLYVSPVGFSTSVVPEKWRLLFSLNPMVGVIDAFRWCVLGTEKSAIWWPSFFLSMTVIALMLWIGIRYFRSVERTFADMI